MLVCTGARPR